MRESEATIMQYGAPYGAIDRAASARDRDGPLTRVRRMLRSVAEFLRARRARRLAYRELMGLDEGVLRDVGISRCAIPALVRGTWFDEPQARRTLAGTARRGGHPGVPGPEGRLRRARAMSASRR